jgi:prepilin-type N-terminal cleavage/methylation domain-containing protein
MKNKFSNQKGFTLIELLVVIAIIGLLTSVITASLNNSRAKARDAKRIEDLRQMSLAIEMYYNIHGQYPRIEGGDEVTNWSNLLDTLKDDNLISSSETQDKTSGFLAAIHTGIPPFLNTQIQDPLYPSYLYEWSWILPYYNHYQAYRIRAKLEMRDNPVLQTGLSGDFLGIGDNGCNKDEGYYCVGTPGPIRP